MHKFALKIAAVLVSVFGATLCLTACGDDDDDPSSATNGSGGPTSITYNGRSFFKATYDSNGRMTSMTAEDMKMKISYSPLSITFVEDGDKTTFSNIETNSLGYITKAKVTETYDGETEVSWFTCSYDSAGHWTGISQEDDDFSFTWSGTDVAVFEGDDFYIYRFSSEKNTAGVFSPNWGILGLWGITGLFGKAPDFFPSSLDYYNDFEDDGWSESFSYSLLADGRIDKEAVTMYGQTITLNYNYGSRAIDNSPYDDGATVAPKKSMNIFKRLHK